jgi:predicted nicotinamide N-methyase
MEFSAETKRALEEFLGTANGNTREARQDEDDEDDEIHTETIGNFQFRVKIAEAEWNDEKKTLFATMLWNGAKNLGHYLINQASDKVIERSVLELGAGVGLPSLVCGAMGASFVCVSDYPTDHILSVIQENICLNGQHLSAGRRMEVVGHKWGTSVASLLERNGDRSYDLIIASECLWRHEQVC